MGLEGKTAEELTKLVEDIAEEVRESRSPPAYRGILAVLMDLLRRAGMLEQVHAVLADGTSADQDTADLARARMKDLRESQAVLARPDPVYQRSCEATALLQAAGMGMVLGQPNCMVNMVEEIIADRDALKKDQADLAARLAASERAHAEALGKIRAVLQERDDARAGWGACSEALIEMECKHLAAMQFRALSAENRLEMIRMATPHAAADLMRRIDAWEDSSEENKALLICCRCGEQGKLRPECEPAPLCDHCTHKAAEMFGSAVQELAQDRQILAEGLLAHRRFALLLSEGKDPTEASSAGMSVWSWWRTHGCMLDRDETRKRPPLNPFDPDELRRTAEASASPVALDAFRALQDQLKQARHDAERHRAVSELVLSSYRKYMDWLPIDTYEGKPCEHHEVLGFIPKTADQPCDQVVMMVWSEDEGAWLESGIGGKKCRPTHWMPKPRQPR